MQSRSQSPTAFRKWIVLGFSLCVPGFFPTGLDVGSGPSPAMERAMKRADQRQETAEQRLDLLNELRTDPRVGVSAPPGYVFSGEVTQSGQEESDEAE
jgi:hypothetical protein